MKRMGTFLFFAGVAVAVAGLGLMPGCGKAPSGAGEGGGGSIARPGAGAPSERGGPRVRLSGRGRAVVFRRVRPRAADAACRTR